MPIAEPIVVNVISGVGWVVKLWFNLCLGLTDAVFWVSAAKAGVLIDKGRERCLSVEAG